MTEITRVEQQQGSWMTQLARGASSMMGLSETAVALSSLVRKRDIGALWELDPVAAPKTINPADLYARPLYSVPPQYSLPQQPDTIEHPHFRTMS